MYPLGDTPDCVCSPGKMEIRCAGKSAMNAGRFYLKCHVNGKHPGSFKWHDEYHGEGLRTPTTLNSDKGKGVRETRVKAPPGSGYIAGRCVACDANQPSQEMKANVLICFTGIHLVMVGFLVGRLF
ncbi:hypothetical protein AAHA92_21916 [Salvia divinorum]|uniref:Uncharacterized protein n=1 Tax=Salvia divinorum TaxID=28513 RepID=A0ABD1GMA9_SALDI